MKLKEVLKVLKYSTVTKINLGYMNRPANHNLTVSVDSELLEVYKDSEVKLLDVGEPDTLYICIAYNKKVEK